MNKIIHYFYDDINIWEKSTNPNFRICFASWKKYCPDYEIKLWHTQMPEFKQMLNDSKFLRECYKRKMWAFIADYVRHYALYHYGGIYLDTDVQLINSFDNYLDKKFFCSIEGDIFNGENFPESAVMGGEKGHIVFKEMLDIYNSGKIFNFDYFIDPIVLGDYLKQKIGFKMINYVNDDYKHKAEKYYKSNETLADADLYFNQKIFQNDQYGIEIYPSEYFCPAWAALGEKAFTQNTVAIHWNQSSWWNNESSLTEIRSYRYSNPIDRFWYRYKKFFATILTFWIPIKFVRRNIREWIKNKGEKKNYDTKNCND